MSCAGASWVGSVPQDWLVVLASCPVLLVVQDAKQLLDRVNVAKGLTEDALQRIRGNLEDQALKTLNGQNLVRSVSLWPLEPQLNMSPGLPLQGLISRLRAAGLWLTPPSGDSPESTPPSRRPSGTTPRQAPSSETCQGTTKTRQEQLTSWRSWSTAWR